MLNTVPLERIVPRLERQVADPGQSEIMQLLISPRTQPVFYEGGFVGGQ